ncbi:MAG: hypothetical protein ABFS12_18635 [Bacteroidota bacterium]
MKRALIFIITYSLLISCNSDKNNSLMEELLGEWKLVSFVNEADGTSIDVSDPDYYDPVNNSEVLITIKYKEDYVYEGITGRNVFGGNYTLNNSKTVIIFYCSSPENGHCVTTEVNETDFGNLFFDNLYLNYNHQTENIESSFELSGDIFKSYYSEHEYMKFERM